MKINALDYYDDLADRVDESMQNKLYDILDAVNFKLFRNSYHFENIKSLVARAPEGAQGDFYGSIQMPIYFEIESLLISLRSSVDILLHLIDFCFGFNLPSNDVTLYSVYHHPSLPKAVKNIFERYTRPYNNPTWKFIYTFRNEIVHEKSIHQVLPVNIDLFFSQGPLAFFRLESEDKEMIAFFTACLRFLDTFSSQIFESVRVSL